MATSDDQSDIMWVGNPVQVAFCRRDGLGDPTFAEQSLEINYFDGTEWVPSVSQGGIDWGYDSGRAWVSFGNHLAYCRRVGSSDPTFAQQRIAVTYFDGADWVTSSSPGGIDWGYATGRAWIAAGNRVAYCRRVGVGGSTFDQQRLQVTYFDGTEWVTVVSPGGIDWGYQPDQAWIAFNGQPAYCRRVGISDPAFAQQRIAATYFDGADWVTSSSPGGIDWGYATGRAWIAVGEQLAYCRRVGISDPAFAQRRIAATFSDGAQWATSTSPGGIDWGYTTGLAWVSFKGQPAYCRRVGIGGSTFAQQHLQVTTCAAEGWVTTTSPAGIDWGYDPDQAWVGYGGQLAYGRRVGIADPTFAQQRIAVTCFGGAEWDTSTSPGSNDWGYVPAPGSGLGSNSNYILTSNCSLITNLNVLISVTQDIVSDVGFSFQLNTYSPQQEKCGWQQYVLVVPDDASVHGTINNWPPAFDPGGKNWIINDDSSICSLPKRNIIPAGYNISIALVNDSQGNVSGVTFTVEDGRGVRGRVTKSILDIKGVTADDLAPIVAFELNLVGPYNKEIAELSSGAGQIYYYSPTSRMSVQQRCPVCAEADLITAETANSSYSSLMPDLSTSFTQDFAVNTSAPMIRKTGPHMIGRPRPLDSKS